MLSRTPAAASRVLQCARQQPVRQWHHQRLPLSRPSQRFAPLQARRFQSTSPHNTAATASGSGSSALVGGLAGGGFAFLLGYLWYSFSGAKSIVSASKKTQAYLDSAKQKVASTASNIEPSEALDWLRSTTLTYVAFIPGAKGYVNTAFDDLDRIREKHGDEVDKAVRDAYTDLKNVVSKKGASYETASKAMEILSRFAEQVGGLAGDAAEDIIENHPKLKKKLGGSVEQLKQLSNSYGPEIKKEVDDVWKQLSDVIKSGSTTEAIDKAYKLMQDKTEAIRGMVDEAWNKGMEQAKPYLDRNPKVKQLVEENKDALRKGDFGQLWGTVKQAAESGNTEKLESFVKEKAQQAKDAGFGDGLDKLLQMIPGGEQIAPKLEQLQQIADKRGKEAEKILKETIEEIQEVLKKKVDEAKEVAEKAKKDA